MCSLVAHDKLEPYYKDDESSIGDRSIPKNVKTKALKALGVTINFVDLWLKLFVETYGARCVVCINGMKEMLKKIPQTMSKALTPKKNPKLMTDIGGVWYMWKVAKGLTPLKRSKLRKKSQEKQDEIQIYIYISNKWRNDWMFQLHWNKIEWVDPKTIKNRDKPY